MKVRRRAMYKALPVPRQLADADPHVRSNLSLNAEKKGQAKKPLITLASSRLFS